MIKCVTGDRVRREFFKPAQLCIFILAHLSTYGGVRPQAFSSQDVAMNYILHEGEVHHIGSVTAENKKKAEN